MDEKKYTEYKSNYTEYQSDDSQYDQTAQQTYSGSYYQKEKPAGNGFGIASMVLGILALVFFCGCINIPLAIISIIFAIVHINRKTGSIGFAIAGIVTSAISVILTVILILVVMYAGFGSTAWTYSETLPFEYFMDGEGFPDDFDGDTDEGELPFGEHHHGQDL